MKKDLNQEGSSSWFWIFLVILTLFFLANNVSELRRLLQVKLLLGRREQEAVLLEEEEQRLEEKKEYVQSQDFVEKEAREKLGLGYPNQVRVLLPPSERIPTPTPTIFLPNWRRWWELFR